MKGAEKQTPRNEQNSVKYKIDNFGVNVFVFCLSSLTHWGVGSTTWKIIRVWMFDEDKKKNDEKQPPNSVEYFPPEFVLIVRKELKGKLQTRELFKFSIYVVNVFVFV